MVTIAAIATVLAVLAAIAGIVLLLIPRKKEGMGPSGLAVMGGVDALREAAARRAPIGCRRACRRRGKCAKGVYPWNKGGCCDNPWSAPDGCVAKRR